MRNKLWWNDYDGVYIANDKAEMHGFKDVTQNLTHQITALNEGIFIGSALQFDEMAKKDSEHGHQTALFAWCAAIKHVGISNDTGKMFAIPNGGLRNKATASNLKAEGVRKGVPDIFLPVPVIVDRDSHQQLYAMFKNTKLIGNSLAGLFIEMKKSKLGRVSDEQKFRMEQLQKDGYAVIECRSWREARDAISVYLNLNVKIKEFIKIKDKSNLQ